MLHVLREDVLLTCSPYTWFVSVCIPRQAFCPWLSECKQNIKEDLVILGVFVGIFFCLPSLLTQTLGILQKMLQKGPDSDTWAHQHERLEQKLTKQAFLDEVLPLLHQLKNYHGVPYVSDHAAVKSVLD